ncbi:putative glycosyl transferase [Caloramator mitchellensis]|uniref:Putative glycosyl transferase n=1 Tax=Caloramator mitchellensis TaxID=908809 RepID=A0A0R3JV74_CALMK|nr:glycosyltransferase family 4 protein [Caloramator mitchellensis]KRQ87432.1 putative glycosyl transferase [Caloramator mitchellensis]
MKRIWIMNHYAVPPYIGGGTRHFDLAEELAGRGYDVTVFASSFDLKTRTERLNEGERYRIEEINGVKFFWIRTYPYKTNDYKRFLNMISFAVNSYRILSRLERPDVILASSVHPFTCISGYYLAKKFGARYIAEIRDLWPETLIDMGAMRKDSISAKVFYAIEKFIYDKAEKIIVLLPGAKDYINSVGNYGDKVEYIPNGVVVKRYDEVLQKNEKSSRVEEILIEHAGKLKAVYLGAMGPANALDVILNAAKILKDEGINNIDILLIGDGPEKEKLINMKNELGLENVSIYDPIKKYDVPFLLDGIDICLFNLKDLDVFKYGISPNKLFDYLCSAKPILFSCKAVNDIVKEANAGISIEPESPERFAAALKELANMDEHKRRELGQNGRRYVEQNHDISRLVDKLDSLF